MDRNIFEVVAEAVATLIAQGRRDEVKAMTAAVLMAQSYDEAVAVIEDCVGAATEAEADAEWDRYWAEQDQAGA
jgi:hypothetical protein